MVLCRQQFVSTTYAAALCCRLFHFPKPVTDPELAKAETEFRDHLIEKLSNNEISVDNLVDICTVLFAKHAEDACLRPRTMFVDLKRRPNGDVGLFYLARTVICDQDLALLLLTRTAKSYFYGSVMICNDLLFDLGFLLAVRDVADYHSGCSRRRGVLKNDSIPLRTHSVNPKTPFVECEVPVTDPLFRPLCYKYPDPASEIIVSETDKFRDHLINKLSNKEISADQSVEICTELFANFIKDEYGGKGALKLDMSGRNYGDRGLFYIAHNLDQNKVAEEVSFANNGITAEGIKVLDCILPCNRTLKSLDLSRNNIGDEGAKILCNFLVKNYCIQKLQLNRTGLGDEAADAIAEMLKKNSSLRTLELNDNLISYSGFSALAEAFLENKSLRTLYLNRNYGGAFGASALAKGLKGNEALRELFLRGNSIGDEGVRALTDGLSSHKGKLTALDIGKNMITSKGAIHVAEFIKRSKSLLSLNVYINDIKDEGAEKIAEALKWNRSITNIDLGRNDIHAKGATAIAEVLEDNNDITSIIFYNPIGPDGAKALADILKFHGNIKTLNIGWCKIGAEGAEYIADTLKYNNTISTLDLRANKLTDEGAKFLACSLKVIKEGIELLDLCSNQIRDEGAFSISEALKANEDLRLTSLFLAKNFLTKLGKNALLDAGDHVCKMNGKELTIRLSAQKRK
ncbi:hypothetical protein QVD17_03635 [Tagetes erecta]|uniref:Uncharacterized protein n=1 Tax=Tagetes erecta TaxID=13708 RepID=A0AAD8P3J5_TARER|nr:hypothetical protein QVD17_03635 [Tagetes erecta]